MHGLMVLKMRLNNKQNTIAKDVLKEISERLEFLLMWVLLTLRFIARQERFKRRRKPAHQACNADWVAAYRALLIFWMNRVLACIKEIISA